MYVMFGTLVERDLTWSLGEVHLPLANNLAPTVTTRRLTCPHRRNTINGQLRRMIVFVRFRTARAIFSTIFNNRRRRQYHTGLTSLLRRLPTIRTQRRSIRGSRIMFGNLSRAPTNRTIINRVRHMTNFTRTLNRHLNSFQFVFRWRRSRNAPQLFITAN